LQTHSALNILKEDNDVADLARMNLLSSGLQSNKVPETSWVDNPKHVTTSNILTRNKTPSLAHAQMDEVKRYIITMLGAPVVKVELQDEQLENVISMARDTFVRYLGRERYSYTVAKSSQTEYNWPDDALVIFQVFFRPATLSALGNISQNLFSDFYLLATDLAVDIYESPTTYWCYLASREMLEKTYGVWGSWENVDYRRFRVYPSPMKDQIIGIYYKANDFDLSEDKYNLFKKLCLAYAKTILGRIRSKYASIPGSNNSLLTLDGSTLLTEGAVEEKEIIKDIILQTPLRFEVF